MEKQDFYLTNKEITQKTQETTAGSWNKLAQGSLICVLIIAVPVVATIILAQFFSWYVTLIMAIISFIVFAIMNYGYHSFMQDFVDSTTTKLSTLFSGFSKSVFKIIILHFVMLVVLAIGYALFIVPGVLLTLRYSMTLFCLRDDNKLSVFKAMSKSGELMKDNYLRLFKTFFVNVKWLLLGLVTAGVGLLWLLPKYLTTKVIFYEDLKTDF